MKSHFKSQANLLIMVLAMAFAFFACEEKKKPEAEQPATENGQPDANATPTEEATEAAEAFRQAVMETLRV